MNKHIPRWIILICSMCFVASCTTHLDLPQEANPLSEMKCYQTFEEFAYSYYGSFDEQLLETLLPSEPWQIEATIPKEFYGYAWQVSLTRFVDGIPEIWLTKRGVPQEKIPLILVYYPDSNSWISVSSSVEESDIFVKELYLTDDGTIWGWNRWTRERNPTPSEGSILSKYNEQTNQFEFVSGLPQIPFVNEERALNIQTLLDKKNNKFWIAIESDGLYTYEPHINRTTKQAELQDISVGVLASATDGTIYFISVERKRPFYMDEVMLMQYSPRTGEFTILENPDEPWPIVGPPRITKSDQLWLGSVGYRDLNAKRWHLVLPEPNSYTEGSRLTWPVSPQVILEDETGILWFGVASEPKDGTAWYDVDTGEGCMFTNLYANIVEDSQQRLWMFADGRLYRYSLNE